MHAALAQLPTVADSPPTASEGKPKLFMASQALGSNESCWDYPSRSEQESLQQGFCGFSPLTAMAATACPAQAWPVFFRRAVAALDQQQQQEQHLPPVCAVLVAPSMWAAEEARSWDSVLQAAALQVPTTDGFRPQGLQRAQAASTVGPTASNLAQFLPMGKRCSGVVPGDGMLLGGLHQWLVTVDEPVLAVMNPNQEVGAEAPVAEVETSTSTSVVPTAPGGMQVSLGPCGGLSQWWHGVAHAAAENMEFLQKHVCIASCQAIGEYDCLGLLPSAVSDEARRVETLRTLLAMAAPGMWRVPVQGKARGANTSTAVQMLLFHPWVFISRVLLLKLQLTCRWWAAQTAPRHVALHTMLNEHLQSVLDWQTSQLRQTTSASGGLALKAMPALHILLGRVCFSLPESTQWPEQGTRAWADFCSDVSKCMLSSIGNVPKSAALEFALQHCRSSLAGLADASARFQAMMPPLQAVSAEFGHPAVVMFPSTRGSGGWACGPRVYSWPTLAPPAALTARELSVYGGASQGKHVNARGSLIACTLFTQFSAQLHAAALASAGELLSEAAAAQQHALSREPSLKASSHEQDGALGKNVIRPALSGGSASGASASAGTPAFLSAPEAVQPGRGPATPTVDQRTISTEFQQEITHAAAVMSCFEGGSDAQAGFTAAAAHLCLRMLELVHCGKKEETIELCHHIVHDLHGRYPQPSLWEGLLCCLQGCTPRAAAARQITLRAGQLHKPAAQQLLFAMESVQQIASDDVHGFDDVQRWYALMACLGVFFGSLLGTVSSASRDSVAGVGVDQSARLASARKLRESVMKLQSLTDSLRQVQHSSLEALCICTDSAVALASVHQHTQQFTVHMHAAGLQPGILHRTASNRCETLFQEVLQVLQTVGSPNGASAGNPSLQQIIAQHGFNSSSDCTSGTVERQMEATWEATHQARQHTGDDTGHCVWSPRVELLAAQVSSCAVASACQLVIHLFRSVLLRGWQRIQQPPTPPVISGFEWALPFPTGRQSHSELCTTQRAIEAALEHAKLLDMKRGKDGASMLQPRFELYTAAPKRTVVQLQMCAGEHGYGPVLELVPESKIHLPDALLRGLSEQDRLLCKQAAEFVTSPKTGSGQSPAFIDLSPSAGAAAAGSGFGLALDGSAAAAQSLPSEMSTTPDKQELLPRESIEQLDIEVKDMAKEIMTIAAAVRTHKASLVENVSMLTHTLWPDSRVEVFGSYATGLDLPGSDVDCVICDVEEHYNGIMRGLASPCLPRLLSKLSEAPWVLSAEAITQTAVPVIKVLAVSGQHNHANIRMDISFDGPRHRGVSTAAFIRQAVTQHPALVPVSVVFKHMLVTHNLNEPFLGGISSYAVVLLVLAVLKEYPALPAVLTDMPVKYHEIESARPALRSLGGVQQNRQPSLTLQSRTATTKVSAAKLRADIAGALYAGTRHVAASVGSPVAPLGTIEHEAVQVNLGKVLIHVLELAARLCANAKYWALDVSLGVLYRRGEQFRDDPLVIVDPNEQTNNVGKAAWGFEAVHSTLMASVRRLASRRFQYRGPPAEKRQSLLGAIFGAHHHQDVVELIRKVWLARKNPESLNCKLGQEEQATAPADRLAAAECQLLAHQKLLLQIASWHSSSVTSGKQGLPDELSAQVTAHLVENGALFPTS